MKRPLCVKSLCLHHPPGDRNVHPFNRKKKTKTKKKHPITALLNHKRDVSRSYKGGKEIWHFLHI